MLSSNTSNNSANIDKSDSAVEDFVFDNAKLGARIVTIGIGGGGGNMVQFMIEQGISGIEYVVANTDAQALSKSKARNKIQLGAKLTKGLGAGMKPEIGKESALESIEDIRRYIEGSDIIFIGAGLGGGTGTGAAPIIAQIAKEMDVLTVAVVTQPFKFEGKKREELARIGFEELKKEVDSIVVIPNEKLHSITDKKMGIKESFRMVDQILAQAVDGTSGVILSNGTINLDFADLKTIMTHKGLALLGIGSSRGDNAAMEAIKGAIHSPLLNNMSINGALGVLVNFKIHPDYPLVEITNAMDMLQEVIDSDAEIIFGTTDDETMPNDEVYITLVATGFEQSDSEFKEAISEKVETKIQNNSNYNPINKPSENATVRKVASTLSHNNSEYLDIPTYIRNKID